MGSAETYPAMNISDTFPNNGNFIPARWPLGCLAAMLAMLIGFCGSTCAVGRGPTARTLEAPGTQVLTRGPVHEAFAEMISYNPEPGIVVTKTPPDPIEEVPPEERPEGDNVAWIPGYWAWDDERNDFLWVSGTWRALPPGREWMSGYWAQTPARLPVDFRLLGRCLGDGNHLSAGTTRNRGNRAEH